MGGPMVSRFSAGLAPGSAGSLAAVGFYLRLGPDRLRPWRTCCGKRRQSVAPQMSGSIRMFPAGDAVLLREHGIEHTPTNPLESCVGRARLVLVESYSYAAPPSGGGCWMRGSTRGRLICSQQGDLSSAPLTVHREALMA